MNTLQVTLEQWRVLQAVVDHGGFAQAAAQLYRSQSSISYTVAKLQEQLGIPLLKIEGRKAQLTPAGEALLRRSRHLLQEAMELEQFAHSLDQGWEAEVRLVVDTAFPTKALMRALHRFQPLSHGTRVQLREEVLSGAEEVLERGEADLAICANVPPNLMGDPLLDLEFIAVAHRDHSLHQLERPITTSDLERELQVVIRDSGLRRQRDVGWLGAEHRWSVSSLDTAIAAITEGLGYAWLPKHAICGLLQQDILHPLPLREGGHYKGALYLAYGGGQLPGPGTRQLAHLIKEEAQKTIHD